MSVERIHDQLRGLATPVERLEHDKRNARKHSPRNLSAIARSLDEHGQRKPLVAQRVGERLVVRAGNGTLEAARSLGWTHLAVVVVEEGDKAATRYALADNRTAELAEWDDETLRELLGEVCDSLDELPDLGWEPDEVGLDADDAARDETYKLNSDFSVLVECESEAQQLEILEQAERMGWKCRALI